MPNYGYLINKALQEGMAKHKNMILLGEDICMPYGGAFKITYNLSTKYSDRVLNMPISEAGMIGFATGLAIQGFLPVVEIMFGDFLTLCFDQIYNHAAKFEWMYNVKTPMIIRTPMGGGRGYGPTHSQSIEKHFLGIPGFDVFALNEMLDPKEFYLNLFETIQRPTLIIENKLLYSRQYSELKNCTKPQVSIYCYGDSASLARQAVDESGIDCEILVSDKISSIDSVLPKTNKIIIVEEGHTFGSWGTEIALGVKSVRKDSKVLRIGNNEWIPCARDQELAVLPSVKSIKKAIFEIADIDVLLYGNGGHAKCIKEILENANIMTIVDDEWKNSIYICDKIILGVGLIKQHAKRSRLFNEMKELGYKFPNVIHKTSHIENSVALGNGVQVFANAVLGSDCEIGDNCIINSGAIISHDCILGNNVHVAPGATLAGGVEIGDNTLIGMGATVYAGVEIGNNCVVYNGSCVNKNMGNSEVCE